MPIVLMSETMPNRNSTKVGTTKINPRDHCNHGVNQRRMGDSNPRGLSPNTRSRRAHYAAMRILLGVYRELMPQRPKFSIAYWLTDTQNRFRLRITSSERLDWNSLFGHKSVVWNSAPHAVPSYSTPQGQECSKGR